MGKKTLVLGASENIERYSNMATKSLRLHGNEVVAIGKKEGIIEDVKITTQKVNLENIDTVSIYLNPKNQEEYEAYILSLKPKRIIFNPGAENRSFAEKAGAEGVIPMEACTLVLLATGQY